MDEIVKKTLISAFKNTIDNLIVEDKSKNQFEWNNNPLYAIAIITTAIGTTEKAYKEMLKNNLKEFNIEYNQVDKFVNDLSLQVHNKYFEK